MKTSPILNRATSGRTINDCWRLERTTGKGTIQVVWVFGATFTAYDEKFILDRADVGTVIIRTNGDMVIKTAHDLHTVGASDDIYWDIGAFIARTDPYAYDTVNWVV